MNLIIGILGMKKENVFLRDYWDLGKVMKREDFSILVNDLGNNLGRKLRIGEVYEMKQ